MERLTIGKLSKLVGLSADTLRYYDEIGLFKPAAISGETGYRYYAPEQAAVLARIMELKEYGFSLEEIKRVLAGSGVSLTETYQNRYWQLRTQKRQLQEAIDKLANKIKQSQEALYMGKKIFIVDDANFMRMICRDTLTREGYEIAGEAGDGAEAAEMYPRLSPDLVLLNIVMPTWDGLYTLQRIREAHPDARAVMLSAMGQARMVTECLLAGAKGFIVKPFQSDELLSQVRGAFQEEKFFNPAVLRRIHDQCADNTFILTQAEIHEITVLAQLGDANHDMITAFIQRIDKAVAVEHGSVGAGNRAFRTVDGTAPHDPDTGDNGPVLALLNQIAEGQEEIKTLLRRLVEEKKQR